jgi:hypothetical protein
MYKALVAIGVLDSETNMVDQQINIAIGSIKLIKKYASMYGKDELYEDFVKRVKEVL